MAPLILLFKSHVKGYTRKDGHYVNPYTKDNSGRHGVQHRVPVKNSVLQWAGLGLNPVVADYFKLHTKHSDQFPDEASMRSHVQWVMEHPHVFMPATKDGYVMFVRRGALDKCVVINPVVKGGANGYVVRSAYIMNEDQLKSYIKAVFKYRKYNVKIRKSISVGALSPSFLSGSELSERSTRWLPISHEKVQLIAKCNLPEDSNLIKWMIESGINYKNTSFTKSDISMDRYSSPYEPSEYQIKSGNYKKRSISWNGLTIKIENEAGSVRSGQDPNGKLWEVRMIYPYGYVSNSTGVDGDEVDIYLGFNLNAPIVYIVHQRKVGDWSEYDEDKCMIGFDSEDDARQAFLHHYDDPRFLGEITAMSVGEFVDKVKATNKKPAMIKALPVTLSERLAKAGFIWREVPFTRESWDGEFPGNMVKSFMGDLIELLPETLDYPDYGSSLIGALKPTIESPLIIHHEVGQASFFRAIINADGSILGYSKVTLWKGFSRVEIIQDLPALEGCIDHGINVIADFVDEGHAVFKCLSLGKFLVTDFGIASHLMDWGVEFFKSDHGAIPDGARWITVHPNGEGSKGVPILVQPAKDNSGTFRVVGGAGGKLNMLKLRGVKSEADYKQEHSERAHNKRLVDKERIRRDKELGIHDAKTQAKENINAQRKKSQKDFIKTVADAMGWKHEETELNTSGLSEQAAKKAELKHHAELLTRAKEAVNVQRKMLVDNADARAAAGLGVMPLHDENAALISADDLDPVRLTDKSGISQDFKKRAENAGLTQDSLDSKVSETKTTGKTDAQIERGQIAQDIKDELSKLPKPDLNAKIVDAKKAVELIKAQKKLAAMEKAARDANKEVNKATVEPKAYVLATSEPDDKVALKAIHDDLSTSKAKAFLAGVQAVGGEESIESHVSTGAYNVINALSHAVGGDSLMDRSVIDVLGIAGAAQVLARRLHSDYKDKTDDIASGVEEYHVAHAPELQSEALAQAQELQDIANKIEMDQAANSQDFAHASGLNHQRKEHLATARKVMGQALGEMEANAAISAALRGGKRDFVQVSLGKSTSESAVQQLWALGLNNDDFNLDKVAGNTFATIKASGMDKLAKPIDKENMQRIDRNLSIMRGDEDEDDWLPQGFSKRPDLGLNFKAGVAPQLSQPFDAKGSNLADSVREYIGGRMADGDRPADILSDLNSLPFMLSVGADRASEYRKALNEAIPTKNFNGKLMRVEHLEPIFQQYADDYVASKWGGTRSTLNKQTFEPDAIAQDALHRALASEPAGKIAYKPIGELTAQDRSALRNWFYKNVAKESPEQAGLREKADNLQKNEPIKFTEDLFGEVSENPAWKAWKSDYDEASAVAADAGLDWGKYSHLMRGSVRAFESIQDLIRSKVSESFAQNYNTQRPDAALKIGKTIVRNNLNHLDAVDPTEREKRLKAERSLIDSLRERVQGKYSSGSVGDKIEQAKEKQAAYGQAQMSLFSSEEDDNKEALALKADERKTIGHAAENMINKMMGVVGANFEPNKPVKLFNPSMSGPDGVKRQRAIKLVEANKRVMLGAGVGSGKSAMMLGAFSSLHSQGKIKKGVICCPSIVQGQMGAEALRFLEAGKYNWHCNPGDSFESRLASYKDPDNHFTVVTHQSFRDDLLKMASLKTGESTDVIADKMGGMTQKERASYTKDVLDHHGINFDFSAVDEGHNLLDREGKENSRMSNVIGGVTDNTPYHISATADPVKNDASEAFSALQKMDGDRYNDRDAFMRRYGSDTQAAKQGLQKELARHLYAMEVKPDISVNKQQIKVPQTEAQQEALKTVEQQAASLRIAKMTNQVDIKTAQAFAPAMFDGVPEDQHEAVAKKVADSVGIMKQSAIRKVLDNHPAAGKLNKLIEIANGKKGQQGVVFAHSLEAVESIRKRLEAEGHRVVTISGKDSAKDKAAKIQAFNPDKGDAKADIIVCSDAGATGANLQSGRWLAQYDIPQTAMNHAQRQGRINRIGQKNNIDLIDLVSDHESDKRAQSRLSNKYALRNLMTTPLDSMDDSGLGYYLKQQGIGAAKPQSELF